jgi:hypothetical protein
MNEKKKQFRFRDLKIWRRGAKINAKLFQLVDDSIQLARGAPPFNMIQPSLAELEEPSRMLSSFRPAMKC